jgi:dolichol kinase
MGDYTPTDKVASGAIAGAAATVVIGVLALFGIVLDPSLVAAAVTLITFAAAWIKTETRGTGTKPSDG